MKRILMICIIASIIVLCSCRTTNRIKVVTEVPSSGKVSWHTEYEVEW